LQELQIWFVKKNSWWFYLARNHSNTKTYQVRNFFGNDTLYYSLLSQCWDSRISRDQVPKTSKSTPPLFLAQCTVLYSMSRQHPNWLRMFAGRHIIYCVCGDQWWVVQYQNKLNHNNWLFISRSKLNANVLLFNNSLSTITISILQCEYPHITESSTTKWGL
jgi:hypothetical protein